jgi:hypothetical protein
MDLLGGYGSEDDDSSEPLAMNGPAVPPPDDDSSNESAVVQHAPHARALTTATPSIAPLPRSVAPVPSAADVASSSTAQSSVAATAVVVAPAIPQTAAAPPPPKRKLPSAAALLSAVPTSHTYAGFKSASSASSAAVEERTDAIGTKYNSGALRHLREYESEDPQFSPTDISCLLQLAESMSRLPLSYQSRCRPC